MIEWENLSETCQNGLQTAMGDNIRADIAALNRAWAQEGTLINAAAGAGVDWKMLGAIGLRETAFRDISQAGGLGMGVFQIDLGKNPSVTGAQALSIPWAAQFAANMLASNYATLAAEYPALDPAHLLQATAASYNLGVGGISGNPDTIDVGSSHDNYGRNVLDLMDCFK